MRVGRESVASEEARVVVVVGFREGWSLEAGKAASRWERMRRVSQKMSPAWERTGMRR